MDEFKAKVEAFAATVTREMREEMARQYGAGTVNTQDHTCLAHVHYGAKYARVDVGRSGRYMIPMPSAPDAGMIYSIKGYGVVHRGHTFGSLDTVTEFNWGFYRAVRRTAATTT